MSTTKTNGSMDLEGDIEVSPAIFQELSDLEKEFAVVELDALRKKEFNLRPLYTRRSAITSQLPSFWPQVLLNGPQEFQSIRSQEVDDETHDGKNGNNTAGVPAGNIDIATISAVKNLTIDRYQIESETKGEPRSLRFTFEFDKNPVFEDSIVVKEFEYVSHSDGETGGLVSKPVTFKWTKQGKKLIQAKTGGLLDLAVELYQAEEAAKFNVKGNKDGSKPDQSIDVVAREGLWQYEKLRDKLEKLEDQSMMGDGSEPEGSWLEWFGYRGRVDMGKTTTSTNAAQKAKGAPIATNRKKHDKEDEDDFEDDYYEEDDDDEDNRDGLLEVEIFPAGEEVAIALADDLWPNVMDYFLAAQDPLDNEEDYDESLLELDDNEDDDDDEEVPDLIEADADADMNNNDEMSSRPPSKKLRMK